ncbi:hypothetical protein E4U58_001908 [Claviceps cyperi]|nr:hypothetical protein E4U58_001908 [Claviceps cyperi]
MSTTIPDFSNLCVSPAGGSQWERNNGTIESKLQSVTFWVLCRRVSTPKLPCSFLLDFSGQQVQFVEMEHVRAPPGSDCMGHKKGSDLKRAATAREGVSLMPTVSDFHVSDHSDAEHVSKDRSPPCTPVKPNFYI